MTHFNKLTPGEAERLAILAEESSEVTQSIMKILRHGWGGSHPSNNKYVDNTHQLESELGDVQAAARRLAEAGDIDMERIKTYGKMKMADTRYLHHQGPEIDLDTR